MSTSLIQVELPPKEPPIALTQAQALLRQMVLDALPSVHSKRNYAKALDNLFSFCDRRPLSRALPTSNHDGSPFSINYQRPLVGDTKAGRRSETQRHDRA